MIYFIIIMFVLLCVEIMDKKKIKDVKGIYFIDGEI